MSKKCKASAALKPHFRAASRADGTLELVVYEDIGADWFGEGVTAKTVKQQIDAATFDKISIRINSPGGDAFEGIAIFNLIRSYGKPVDVFVDGIAASAASIIAMAGDTITMGHNAMLMIHNAWSICMGDAPEMRKMADTLEKVSGAIAQTYVDRTGKSMDDVKALLDAETWMSAEEAVAEGFATAIAEQPDGKKALALARTFKALGKLKHLPDALKADSGACACDCAECMEGDCPECQNAECSDPNCTDCPAQMGTGNSAETPPAAPPPEIESNTSLYEARLAMLALKR